MQNFFIQFYFLIRSQKQHNQWGLGKTMKIKQKYQSPSTAHYDDLSGLLPLTHQQCRYAILLRMQGQQHGKKNHNQHLLMCNHKKPGTSGQQCLKSPKTSSRSNLVAKKTLFSVALCTEVCCWSTCATWISLVDIDCLLLPMQTTVAL